MARPILKIGVTLFTLLCFTACTTLQPLPDTQPATIQQQATPGTKVEIERMDGTHVALKVESVSADTLIGTGDGKRYEIPLANIKSVSTESMTSEAKIWTTVGILAAVVAVIAGSAGGSGSGGY